MNFLQTLKNLHKKTNLSWIKFWLLSLFFMTFSFGQLGRIELEGVTLYLHHIVILIWLMSSTRQTVEDLNKWVGSINWKKWWLPLVFFGWLIIGMTIAFIETRSVVPWLYLSRLVFYGIFLFSLISQLRNYSLVLKILLVSSGIYMVWFGLLQYLLIPDSRYLLMFGWDEHYYRLIGPLLDPNLSGILYVIIGWCIFSLRSHLPKPLWIGASLLTGTALILTYSRATYAAIIISLLLYFILYSKNAISLKKCAIGGFVILCISFVIYSLAPKPGGDGVNLLRTSSIIARIETSKTYISSLQPYQWVIGTGFYSPLSNTNQDSHAQVPDNIFILLLVNTGLIGMALFLITAIKFVPFILKWEKETLAALIAVLTHAQFNNSLLEPFIFLAMGILIISQSGHRKV